VTDRDIGIITVSDANYFPGLLMLHRSVQESVPCPVACFDVGLTVEQKAVAAARANLHILQLPGDPSIRLIKEAMANTRPLAKAIKRVWPLWICPLLIKHAPFRDVIWMDCDVLVLRHLGELFRALEDGPVFTPENLAPHVTPNNRELYKLLPIDRAFDPLQPNVNAGVSAWRKDRDAGALAAYAMVVERAAVDETVRAAISWHDQGALIWAIQSCGLEHRVASTTAWNLCVDHTALANNPLPWDEAFLEKARAMVTEANIVHWNGRMPPWPGGT
jgi:hypothetical protein